MNKEVCSVAWSVAKHVVIAVLIISALTTFYETGGIAQVKALSDVPFWSMFLSKIYTIFSILIGISTVFYTVGFCIYKLSTLDKSNQTDWP